MGDSVGLVPARSHSQRRGAVIGRSKIIRRLNGGGNAEVYEAIHDVHGTVALKVLRSQSTKSEPYRRFRQEAERHSELSSRPVVGILPLLDYDVPEHPDDGHPAWLAMPIAVPIVQALAESSAVSDAVMAVSQIAATLARLHDEGLAHRDIKPSNLYKYQGQWVVGDLGLIDIPGGEPLTIGAKALGPRNFIAPEMILSPDKEDCCPADVYSLGKTLWCLVTGQPIPPPGEHRPDLPYKRLSEWGVAHPRAHYLDTLIGQMSQENPDNRPPMAMVENTLTRWIREPIDEFAASDEDALADISAEMSAVVATLRAPIDARSQRTLQAARLAAEMRPGLIMMLDQLNASNIPAAGTLADFGQVTFQGSGFEHFADVLPAEGRVVSFLGVHGDWNNHPNPFAFLRTMVGASVAGDQSAVVAAAHAIRDKSGLRFVWQGTTGPALLGSSALGDEIARLSAELIANIPLALRSLLNSIRPKAAN